MMTLPTIRLNRAGDRVLAPDHSIVGEAGSVPEMLDGLLMWLSSGLWAYEHLIEICLERAIEDAWRRTA